MSAKKLMVILVVVLVGLIYYYLYHDSFTKRDIPIQVLFRPRIGPRMRGGAQADEAIVFNLSQAFKLTSIEVTPLDALTTNKYAHAIWHLISESNSAPTSDFVYGGRVRGMHPEVKGLAADPLLPSTGYRIVVKAGSQKGEHDFKTPADLAPPTE
jgi:hypothetical protein